MHFVGSGSQLDQDLIRGSGIQFDACDTVQAGPLHGVSLPTRIASLFRLAFGSLQALNIFRRARPHAVFLTGGWVGVPVALAAMLFRVPVIIFVPDIEPGLTLKILGRFAKVITATTADTKPFFPRKTVVATGYPLRADVRAAQRDAAQVRFGLEKGLTTLLVFGGSRGARSINRAVLACVEELLQGGDLQIIHVTGSLDWAEVHAAYQKMPVKVKARYHIEAYVHDMGLAMAAADLVVSRAGASTLGEFPYFHLPSILIPYPHAWRYQKVNAEWLASRGAAILLEDERLANDLLPTIRCLLDAPAQREAMCQAAKALRIEDGAENIAKILLEVMA